MPFINHLGDSPREHDLSRCEAAAAAATALGPDCYETPRLRFLGELRSLTLGGSLGVGDSGNAGVQRF